MRDFHDKPYHSRSDLVGDPNKPQEGSHKTSFAFVSDNHINELNDAITTNLPLVRFVNAERSATRAELEGTDQELKT